MNRSRPTITDVPNIFGPHTSLHEANFRHSGEVEATFSYPEMFYGSAILELCKEVDALKARLADQVVVARNLPRGQAKKLIKDYFEKHHGHKIYPSDLSKEYGLSYFVIVPIIEELEREGEVEKC